MRKDHRLVRLSAILDERHQKVENVLRFWGVFAAIALT
jgi:hypothetical protein